MPIFTATPDTPPALSPAARNWRHQFGRAAFLACGLLLLTAAALKLVGLNVAPFAQYGWLLTPAVQAAAVLWEVLLGGWLLLNLVAPAARRCAPLPWLAAVLTFAAFAAVSGYLGVIGQANCGCFGVIQASPWAAFAVDVSALLLLVLGRPSWTGWAVNRNGLLWVGGVAGVLALVTGAATVTFGSLETAVAKLRGEPLGVSPAALDFGSGKLGDSLSASVTVRNYTDSPVRLIGGTSDCSCLVTQDMPQTIPPGGSATLRVELRIPQADAGQMTRWVEIFTDCPSQRTVRLTAGCRVE